MLLCQSIQFQQPAASSYHTSVITGHPLSCACSDWIKFKEIKIYNIWEGRLSKCKHVARLRLPISYNIVVTLEWKILLFSSIPQPWLRLGSKKFICSLFPGGHYLYLRFTCEAILQVVRWPRGAGSCFQLLNASWGSRCKAALNMLDDVASSTTMWPGSAFHASITRREKCFLSSSLALGFSSFSVCPLDLVSGSSVAHILSPPRQLIMLRPWSASYSIKKKKSWVYFHEAFQDLENFQQIRPESVVLQWYQSSTLQAFFVG